MEVGRKWLAALAVLVAVNLAMAGLLYVRLQERLADPMAPVAGFRQSQLVAPDIPSGDPNRWEEKPTRTVRPSFDASFSIETRFEVGQAYASWGGEARCWVKNTGSQKTFVYGFSFEGDWGALACATVGISIQPGSERYLGMLHFPGPADFGRYHRFTIKTALMAPAPLGPDSIQWWYDFGYVGNTERTIAFLPQGGDPHYSERSNPKYYFEKANRIMSSNDPGVLALASELAANHSGVYNIYQLAGAFDYVFDNLKYVNDPAGKDDWATPNETLRKMGGDCEDHAFLMAALATAMGGNARFHMEKDHAFLSVFVGRNIGAVQAALEKYYNTPLEVASFQDAGGFWLVADSTASMYLGGLPLGGQPLASGWGLTNTTFHYVIDMMPD